MTNLQEAVDQVAQNNSELKKYLDIIPQKYKKTNKGYLETLVELMYYLYILNKKEILLELLEEIINIEPTANKDIWTWVERGLVLYARILREDNENSETIIKIKKAIISAQSLGSEIAQQVNKKNFERTLRGEILNTDKINQAIEKKDDISEADYRLPYLMNLIKIRELGASKEFSIGEAESQILDNINRLQEIIDSKGLTKLIPFK